MPASQARPDFRSQIRSRGRDDDDRQKSTGEAYQRASEEQHSEQHPLTVSPGEHVLGTLHNVILQRLQDGVIGENADCTLTGLRRSPRPRSVVALMRFAPLVPGQ